MTVKQEGPLPTPRPSHKGKSQLDNKDNLNSKVESKEQPLASTDTSISEKDNPETKENAES